jgi:hypothetical protein
MLTALLDNNYKNFEVAHFCLFVIANEQPMCYLPVLKIPKQKNIVYATLL